MKVKKAGCIVVSTETKKIALIYRENRKDYSFPKGHLEGSETLIECAIRETEEEIKRIPKIVNNDPIVVDYYFDSKNDEVETYYYLAIDNGKSDNDSTDTHDLIWTNIDEVENILTYPSLLNVWSKVKEEVIKLVS